MTGPDVDPDEARRRIEAERTRVESLIAHLRGEGLDRAENDQVGEISDYDQHPADLGSETFEREKDLSILESLEAELAELEAALRRLDDGTYGVDEITGEPIDPARLQALPTARRNVEPPRGPRRP